MLHKDLRVDGKNCLMKKDWKKYFNLPILLVKSGNWFWRSSFPRRGRHLLAGCPGGKIFFTMTMVAGTRSRLNCS